MQIRDLEEFQGITPEQVERYLEWHGWVRLASWERAWQTTEQSELSPGEFVPRAIVDLTGELELAVEIIAVHESRGIQALLRDIQVVDQPQKGLL